MIYIFTGQDDFSVHERLLELKSTLDTPDALSMNTSIFDGARLTMAELSAACDSVPFLGNCRLVIVRGLLGMLESKDDQKQGDSIQWKALPDYAARLPTSTVLVFLEGKLNNRSSVYKKLAPLCRVEEFRPLRGFDLQSWITNRVIKKGGKITPKAAAYLANQAGENLWVLDNEIEKLCLFAVARRIDENDIRKVTTFAREASIFQLVDAIVEKKTSRAMQLLDQIMAEGMAPSHVMHMLTRQFRLILELKDMPAGASQEDIRSKLGLARNYPVNKLVQQSRTYPVPQVIQVLSLILEAELATKTGQWKDTLAMEFLVAQVSSRASYEHSPRLS